MIRLILLLTLLLAWTNSEAKSFRTRHPTEHVIESFRLMNIQQRIGYVVTNKLYPQSSKSPLELIKTFIGEKQVLCKLTLNPDGTIVDVKLLKSSGSKTTDSRALTLIRSAAPFISSKESVPLAYSIDFPNLYVASVLVKE